MKSIPTPVKENVEPHEQANPVPRIVLGLVAGLGIWGASYIFIERADGVARLGDQRNPVALAKSGEAAAPGSAANGGQLFAANCQACHQATGQGLAGVFPPLAGSEWVLGDEKVLAQILIHGLNGRIEVMGKTYQGAMPAFGTQLNDAEIAAVLTHIRSQWGNQAAAVTEATVVAGRQASAGRTSPWQGIGEIEATVGPAQASQSSP